MSGYPSCGVCGCNKYPPMRGKSFLVPPPPRTALDPYTAAAEGLRIEWYGKECDCKCHMYLVECTTASRGQQMEVVRASYGVGAALGGGAAAGGSLGLAGNLLAGFEGFWVEADLVATTRFVLPADGLRLEIFRRNRTGYPVQGAGAPGSVLNGADSIVSVQVKSVDAWSLCTSTYRSDKVALAAAGVSGAIPIPANAIAWTQTMCWNLEVPDPCLFYTEIDNAALCVNTTCISCCCRDWHPLDPGSTGIVITNGSAIDATAGVLFQIAT